MRNYKIIKDFLFSQKHISANNSTRYPYSKITQKLGNIRGQMPGRIRGHDSTQFLDLRRWSKDYHRSDHIEKTYIRLAPELLEKCMGYT